MANTSKRGFASMDRSKQREIASKGGRAAHAKGTAHEFSADEARVAGRKGGETVSRDRAHMSTIGREGGHSRGRSRQLQPNQQSATASLGTTDTERSIYERAADRGNIASGVFSGQRGERAAVESPVIRNEAFPISGSRG
jgi:general stress protein YciG